MAVIQFKRGTAEAMARVNPLLAAGEPGYVIDENRFKIGDGIRHWIDLPYMGENSVVNAATHFDFPSIGSVNTIYKAENEKKIYQWNNSELKYELLSEEQTTLDVSLINGGNANGST